MSVAEGVTFVQVVTLGEAERWMDAELALPKSPPPTCWLSLQVRLGDYPGSVPVFLSAALAEELRSPKAAPCLHRSRDVASAESGTGSHG